MLFQAIANKAMKKHIAARSFSLQLILHLLTASAHCQGLDNRWMGGFEGFAPIPYGGSTINFITGAPDIYYDNRPIDVRTTTSNISDPAGDLLFFTNGVVVGQANGDTMQNGTGLNPSTYTDWYPEGLYLYQANLIMPDPASADEYYLFHNTIDVLPDFVPQFLYASKVDMTLAGGNGAVTQKNQVIFNGNVQPGHLTAVRHGNGRDWWVYAHEFNSNSFLRWLLSPTGLAGPVMQGVGVYRAPDPGQVVISKQGDQFAYFAGETGLDLFSLDRCDGVLSHLGHVDLDSADFGLGVSFSPNGRFLYLSAQTRLYQVDGQASDLQASVTQIAIWDSTYSPGPPFATLFGASKLAPDGKVYISTMNSTDKLHVINYPDSLGAACDIQQHAVTLPTYWFNSLPNHPNYHLGALDGSVCDSLDVGLTEQPENLNLSLYPNPNAGAFAITYAPQPTSGLLEVHALDGRVVHRESVAPWSQLKRVELPRLAPGMYQCTVRFGEQEGMKRFVVEP